MQKKHPIFASSVKFLLARKSIWPNVGWVNRWWVQISTLDHSVPGRKNQRTPLSCPLWTYLQAGWAPRDLLPVQAGFTLRHNICGCTFYSRRSNEGRKKAIKEISERARSTNLDLPQVSKNVTSLLSTCSRFVCGSKPLTILGVKSYPQLAWDVEFGSLVVDQQLVFAYPLNHLMNRLYFSVKSFILPNWLVCLGLIIH